MPNNGFPVDNSLKFDKRLTSFFLRKQVMSAAELNKHLHALPDLTPHSEPFDVQQNRELAARPAMVRAEGTTPALTFASVDDVSDDVDEDTESGTP